MGVEYEQADYGNERPAAFMNPMQNHSSSIIHLTDPDDEIEKMELKLRSCRITKDDKVVSIGAPLMNDVGINSVVSVVQSVVSQTSILSNFSHEEIPKIMEFATDTLAEDLMANRKAYGIKGSNERNKIFFSCLMTIFICLKRGFEEGDRKFWKGSVQEIRSTNESLNKRGGIMSKLNPFSR